MQPFLGIMKTTIDLADHFIAKLHAFIRLHSRELLAIALPLHDNCEDPGKALMEFTKLIQEAHSQGKYQELDVLTKELSVYPELDSPKLAVIQILWTTLFRNVMKADAAWKTGKHHSVNVASRCRLDKDGNIIADESSAVGMTSEEQ